MSTPTTHTNMLPRLSELCLTLLLGRWIANQQLRQIWRFAVTGGICFVCDFAVLVACVEFLDFHYLWAATCGFTLGVVVNFYLSVYWVFSAQSANKARIFVPFVVLALCGLGIINHVCGGGVAQSAILREQSGRDLHRYAVQLLLTQNPPRTQKLSPIGAPFFMFNLLFLV